MTDRPLEAARRIVIKVGTNTLCDPTGTPDAGFMRTLAHQVHRLRSNGKQVLIVSSGAIGCGRGRLGMREMPQDVRVRQALAAIGQHGLMRAWEDAFKPDKVPVAQVLLTHHTFDNRRTYLHLRECLEQILELGAVPILNENDAVSIREIEAGFGDNDRLGALVAAKVEADLYVILSDVEGLYSRPPGHPKAQLIHRVEAISDETIAMANARAGKGGRGGMRSKLDSARELTGAGVPVAIAYGRRPDVLIDLLAGEAIGTWFDAVGYKDGRERWLSAVKPVGRVDIDAGAAQALKDGFHLLPAGVTGVSGQFGVESVVELCLDGRPVARAISQYSSTDLATCIGLHTDEVHDALGINGQVNITRKGRVLLLDG